MNGKTRAIRYVILLVIMCLLCMGYHFIGGGNNDENIETQPNNQVQNIDEQSQQVEILYQFRAEKNLVQHFQKHGGEFDYANEEEYLEGANRVIQDPNALHKYEAEDGDDVYYLEESNEFVIVSTDGYIRTYFRPNDGIKYFNRQ